MWIEVVALFDGLIHGGLVQPPQFEGMVHSTGHYPFSLQVKICAKYFISVTLNGKKWNDFLVVTSVTIDQQW